MIFTVWYSLYDIHYKIFRALLHRKFDISKKRKQFVSTCIQTWKAELLHKLGSNVPLSITWQFCVDTQTSPSCHRAWQGWNIPKVISSQCLEIFSSVIHVISFCGSVINTFVIFNIYRHLAFHQTNINWTIRWHFRREYDWCVSSVLATTADSLLNKILHQVICYPSRFTV